MHRLAQKVSDAYVIHDHKNRKKLVSLLVKLTEKIEREGSFKPNAKTHNGMCHLPH